MEITKNFVNVISLGYFCNVALEIEKIGVRSASYPFDWVISGNFESVLKLISTRFADFMKKDNLSQV